MKIHKRKNAGFTLIELMIVVAIIAIIASVAIPRLLSARLAANESAAISTLRSISSAQAQLQSSGAIDSDNDGGGEYGFFGELSGADFLRESNGAVPPAPQLSADLLDPAMLSAAFGNVAASVVTRSGYVFQMWLPGPAVGALVPGVAEAAGGGMGAVTGPDNCEILWACYAWPLDANRTGNRVFMINQDGDIFSYNNRGAAVYDGVGAGPGFDAAYLVAGDMGSAIANAGAGQVGANGESWTTVN
ncbi:MAG TPA: prepilin-type N-terminal cleavage/methylation domain-containing protein [Planctomycetota bacterium]|nr:prepilin-type N-terminal cleavage/methylation domain-containing protein [Planctomycetota bacterium]